MWAKGKALRYAILAILAIVCLSLLVVVLKTGCRPGLLFEAWKFEPDAVLLLTRVDLIQQETIGFRSISPVEPKMVNASRAESLSLPALEKGYIYYFGEVNTTVRAPLVRTSDYEIRLESAVQDLGLTLIRMQVRNISANSLELAVNQATLDIYARGSRFSGRGTTTRLLPLVIGHNLDPAHFQLMINPDAVHGSHVDPSLEVGKMHDVLGKWGHLFHGESPECQLADTYGNLSFVTGQDYQVLLVYETPPAESCNFNCYLKPGDRPLIDYRFCFDIEKFNMDAYGEVIEGGKVKESN